MAVIRHLLSLWLVHSSLGYRYWMRRLSYALASVVAFQHRAVGRFCNVGQLNSSAREIFEATPPYHGCHAHFNYRVRYAVW